MLELDLGDVASRFLRKLPPKQFGQLDGKIGILRADPYPRDSKLLKGSEFRRADSGEYRIIYKVVGGILYIPLIGKRNDDDVYRRLRRMQ
jgi:mRNA interferase RelE/StbE